MKVIDAETGEPFVLYYDDELQADLEAYRLRECPHSSTRYVRAIASNNSEHIRKQCTDCGLLIGNPIKKGTVSEIYPHDTSMYGLHEERRKREYQAIIQRHVRRQKTRNSQFWQEYAAYLRSDKWHQKRKLVLQRASGVCEGCLSHPATQVHHLSYDNVFD